MMSIVDPVCTAAGCQRKTWEHRLEMTNDGWAVCEAENKRLQHHIEELQSLDGLQQVEIERLTARLIAESGEVEDLVNRLQESEDDNGRLMKRIAKLEADCTGLQDNLRKAVAAWSTALGNNDDYDGDLYSELYEIAYPEKKDSEVET